MIEPTWQSGDVQLFLGDCLEILPQLAAGSVDAVVNNILQINIACDTIGCEGDSNHEGSTGRKQAQKSGSGSNMDRAKAGDRMALQRPTTGAAEDSRILRGIPGSNPEGDEATGDQIARARQYGDKERKIQGREAEYLLSSNDNQGQVFAMRRDGAPCYSSQERKPHGQSLGKPSGSLRKVPQQINKEVVVGKEKISCILTDPPYGIEFISGWTGSCIAGDGSTYLRDEVLRYFDGMPALIFGSPSINQPIRTKCNLVWHRPGSGMGDLSFPWKPDYEFIHVIGDGFAHKKRGPSVLTFAWDTFRGDALHPHQKPLALIKYLLERCPAGTILDPFMGSGTTGVACVQTGASL